MPNKLPFLSRGGYGFIGLISVCFAFVLYDRPTDSIEIVKGSITHAFWIFPRHQPAYRKCRISLENGATLEEQCSYNVGDTVSVCKQNRKIRGPIYYANNCMAQSIL